MLNKKIYLLSLFTCLVINLFFNTHPLYAQKPDGKPVPSDYLSTYNKGDYNEALKILSEKLTSIYSAKSDYQKISTDYIFIKKEEDRKNVNDLFRNRKAQRFFIEDNQELSDLHLYSARCHFKLGNNEASLNNYFESLRYNPLDYQKDDIVFYEISQVYKSSNHMEAYLRSLETAYSLNPTKFEYSLELGKALSITKEKKKAIFHLKRYIESKGDDIPDNNLFLTVGNLNEDIGEYLETAKYYKKYLAKKNEDGYVNFALGYLAYKRTGDHKLALDCLEKSIKYLPENELFRRSKAAEYQADIYMNDLEYGKAIQFYLETKKYHDKIQMDIQENNSKILTKNNEIREAKSAIKTEKLYERYDKYQKLNLEKGKLEFANREMKYEFWKINPGKIRWNMALSYERMDKPDQAIQYFNEAISFDYNSNEARDKIKKLKLKIKRGY
jgi:tetratricopeptide (TPR) repeat protein